MELVLSALFSVGGTTQANEYQGITITGDCLEGWLPLIQIPLICKIYSSPARSPKVSSHDSISLKYRILSSTAGPGGDEAPWEQFLNYSFISTFALDLKTCELKRQVISSIHPIYNGGTGIRIITRALFFKRAGQGTEGTQKSLLHRNSVVQLDKGWKLSDAYSCPKMTLYGSWLRVP